MFCSSTPTDVCFRLGTHPPVIGRYNSHHRWKHHLLYHQRAAFRFYYDMLGVMLAGPRTQHEVASTEREQFLKEATIRQRKLHTINMPFTDTPFQLLYGLGQRSPPPSGFASEIRRLGCHRVFFSDLWLQSERDRPAKVLVVLAFH